MLLALFAIALLAASAWQYKSTSDFLKVAHRSTGVVVEVIERGKLFHSRVRYVDAAGREQEFESRLESRPPRFSVGEHVTVLYLPEALETAEIGNFLDLWWVSLISGILGFSLTIAASVLWIWRHQLFAPALRAQERRTRTRGRMKDR